MASRIQRIVFRSSTADSDVRTMDARRERDTPHDRLDPATVMEQVRYALATVEQTRADLHKREQELLAEASAFYDQLKLTANALADVRDQQASASDYEEKLRAALRQLEPPQTTVWAQEHSESAHGEALVVQAET